MQKLKLVGIIALAAIVTPLIVWAVVFGNGAITLMAPVGQELVVHVDGKEVGRAQAGTHLRVNVEQGDHEVKLVAGANTTTHRIAVKNGTYDELLPLSGQCFALFDVTNFVHEKEKLAHHLMQPIVVKSRFADSRPVEMPAGAHFALADIPTGERAHAELLLDLPCAELAKADAALIKAHFQAP